mgnify:CR=1 FL=1
MMKKILVPFDGSETALRALEFAAGIGKPIWQRNYGSQCYCTLRLH